MPAVPRRSLALLSLVPLLILGFFLIGTPAAQAAAVSTVPADNAVVQQPPSQVVLELGTGSAVPTVRVLDSAGQRVPAGQPAGAAGRYTVPTPSLRPGLYTVTWQAGSQQGAFAFDVDPGASPATVTQPVVHPSLSPLRDILLDWVPWISIMSFVGALALRFLVTAPAAARTHNPGGLIASTDRRLFTVAGIAMLVFVPATLTQLAYQAGDDSFAPGKIGALLGADAAGTVWTIRLLLTAVGVISLLRLVVAARWTPVRNVAGWAGAGLAAGLAELVARVVPTAVPPNVPRTSFTTVIDVVHLFGASIWIGGLVTMTVLALGNAVPAGTRRAFWPTAIKRFSIAATACVAALTLSGLWLYWVHVDGFSQLLSTLYGRTLLVKLLLFGGLAGFGALHQFLILPRVAQLRAAGNERGLVAIVLRQFRPLIAVEALMGLGILLIVPMLSGSARNQHFQAAAADLTSSSQIAGTAVSLRPSGLQPGLTDYRITVADPTVRLVQAQFSADGIPVRTVLATKIDDTHYRVTGFYTPVVGRWQSRITLDGKAAAATFTLPVTAKPAKVAKAKPPLVRGSTWAWGIAEVLAVIAGLFAANRLSGLLSARRVRSVSRATEPMPELVH